MYKLYVFMFCLLDREGLVCANSYKVQVTHLDSYSRGKTIKYKLVNYTSRSYLERWDFLGMWGRSTTLGVPLGPEIRIKNLFRSGIPTFRNLTFKNTFLYHRKYSVFLLFPKDIPTIFYFSFIQVIYSVRFSSQYFCHPFWH